MFKCKRVFLPRSIPFHLGRRESSLLYGRRGLDQALHELLSQVSGLCEVGLGSGDGSLGCNDGRLRRLARGRGGGIPA